MTRLQGAIEAFIEEARYPQEAHDDAHQAEAMGRQLGVLIREMVKDMEGRSNFDRFYPTGLLAGRKEHTEVSDLILGITDACGFDTAILHCAALEEIEGVDDRQCPQEGVLNSLLEACRASLIGVETEINEQRQRNLEYGCDDSRCSNLARLVARRDLIVIALAKATGDA